MPEYETDFTFVVAEITGRIRTLENKYNLLAERLLIVNQNMIEEYKKLLKELRLLNTEIREMKHDITTAQEVTDNVVKELGQFARKEQVTVLEKYINLLNPLRFVTEEQLNTIIEEKFTRGKK